jgi:hypothetical protein
MRIVIIGVAALALAACGGLLSDDEKTTSTNDRHDAGSTTPTQPPQVTDGGTDDPTPEVDIGTLPGLALWIDASKGIELDGSGSGVASWADQSPEHNDLKFHEGHGTLANGNLGVGGTGAGAVAFDGTTSYVIAPSPKLANWSGDFYVVAAIHPIVDVDSNGGIFGCYCAQPDVPGHTLSQFYVSYDHTMRTDVESDGYTDNAKSAVLADGAVVVAFHRSGTTLEARRNGFVDKTETFPHTTTPKCSQAFVGALPGDGTSQTDALYTGALAELVVVQGSVTSNVAAKIEAQLMAKYLLSH